jgi:hypothetical protein
VERRVPKTLSKHWLQRVDPSQKCNAQTIDDTVRITSSAGKTNCEARQEATCASVDSLSALLLTSVTAVSPLLAQQKLSATETKDHIGETATVCGSVVSTRYAASTKGQPTFLNLDKPYPNPVFTVLI